jgi:DNA topoisomerase-1
MSDKKTLVLIESPNKRHCFEHALGTDKYTVLASVGNVYDLPADKMSIDIENDFKATYAIMKDKIDVVARIKAEFKKCKDVIFATDDDVEGEGISWGLSQILGVKNPMRAIYHDTNSTTIKNAIKNLVPLNMNKVAAQHCRRYLDRIIGYQISPILWKAMNSHGSLSAGRVQSVACRLIMERHFEVKKFFENETNSYFKITATFDKEYTAQLYTDKKSNIFEEESDNESEEENLVSSKLFPAKIKNQDEAKTILKKIHKSTFIVSNISEKESSRNPFAPFTTTTVCQEASKKLGMTTKRTMDAAQKLFAAGYCTYHRTDSVILSEEAMKSIKKKVIEDHGKEYYRECQYKNKTAGTQAAHECLRVTDPKLQKLTGSELSNDEIRLYNLIWKRTIACQMAPAKFKSHIAEISISELKDYKFMIEYEECIFDGFLKVYQENKVQDEDKKLPKKKSELEISDVIAAQNYIKPPSYYDECSFLGKLKALGIGRPSTIKSIIDKIQTVNYVKVDDVNGVEKNSIILKLLENGKINEIEKKIFLGKANKRFVPTDLGIVITEFLIKNFPQVMDFKFTSNMEEKLDDIEEGNIKMLDVLNEFYKTFSVLLEKLNKNITVDNLSLKQMKEIGIHPVTKDKLCVSMGRFGPMVQMISENNKIMGTAPIRSPLTMDSITINDAVELLKFPKKLGKHENQDVYLCKGKYGYYLEFDKNKFSLGEDINIDDFTLDDAINKITEKNSKVFWQGKDNTYYYKVLEGKYGMYINAQPIKKTGKSKGKNCKLPGYIDLDTVTLEEIQEAVKKSSVKSSDKKEIKSSDKKEIKSSDKKEIKSSDKKEIKSSDKKEIKSSDEKEIKPKVKLPSKTKETKISKELMEIFDIKPEKKVRSKKEK